MEGNAGMGIELFLHHFHFFLLFLKAKAAGVCGCLRIFHGRFLGSWRGDDFPHEDPKNGN